MTASIPSFEPLELVAGDTGKWRRVLAEYPAGAGWSLGYTLVSAAQRYTFTAAPDGDVHLVTVAASTTANWVANTYTWRAQVSKSGEVYTVGSGTIVVRPSFATATDGRSSARKTFDAIVAVIEGRASSDVAQYEIAGRQLRYIPIPELLALRDRYEAMVLREVAAARSAQGLPDPRRAYVRFGRR